MCGQVTVAIWKNGERTPARQAGAVLGPSVALRHCQIHGGWPQAAPEGWLVPGGQNWKRMPSWAANGVLPGEISSSTPYCSPFTFWPWRGMEVSAGQTELMLLGMGVQAPGGAMKPLLSGLE